MRKMNNSKRKATVSKYGRLLAFALVLAMLMSDSSLARLSAAGLWDGRAGSIAADSASPGTEPQNTEPASPEAEPQDTDSASLETEPQDTDSVSSEAEPQNTDSTSLETEPQNTDSVSSEAEPQNTDSASSETEPQSAEPAFSETEPQSVPPETASKETGSPLQNYDEYIYNLYLSGITEEELLELPAPSVSVSIHEDREGKLALSAVDADLDQVTPSGYGFVWNYGPEEPTLKQCDGAADMTEVYSFAAMRTSIDKKKQVAVRAYLIYDGMIQYSQTAYYPSAPETPRLMARSTAGNAAGRDGGVYMLNNGNVVSSDEQLFGKLYIATPIDIVMWEIEFDLPFNPQPEDKIYLVFKGKMGGLCTLNFNGKGLGVMGQDAKSSYYVVPMDGRLLTQEKNYMIITLSLLAWMELENIQIVIDGGPGVDRHGVAATVDEVYFNDYDSKAHESLGINWVNTLTLDGVTKIGTVTPGKGVVMVNCLTQTGDRMWSSDRETTVVESGKAYQKNLKVKDDFVRNNTGNMTYNSLLINSEGEVISLYCKEVHSNERDNPGNFNLKFTPDKPGMTNEEVMLHVEVEDLFGRPYSYLLLPDKSRRQDQTEEHPYGYVPMGGERVYAYETDFTADQNGIYQFGVAEPDGTVTTFEYSVSNIDRVPPVVTIVGSESITVIEDNDYVDMGAGLSDPLSTSDGLNTPASVAKAVRLEVDYDGMKVQDEGSRTFRPEAGVYRIIYKAEDEAGNVTEAVRTVTAVSRPLALTTDSPAVNTGAGKVSLSGSIRYLGDNPVVERGLVWSIGSSPTVNDKIYRQTGNIHNKDKISTTVNLSALAEDAVYYVCAYARDSRGNVVYGNSVSFNTSGREYGQISLKSASVRTTSRAATAVVEVERSGGFDGTQTVYYRTLSGSALEGTHFRKTAGTLTFAGGTRSLKITVPILDGDQSTWEFADRTFYVELYAVSGGANAPADSVAAVTIGRNDQQSISPITAHNNWTIVMQNNPYSYKKTPGGWNGNYGTEWFPSNEGFSLNGYQYWSSQGEVKAKASVGVKTYSADVYFHIDTASAGSWEQKQGWWINKSDGERTLTSEPIDVRGKSAIRFAIDYKNYVKWSYTTLTNPKLLVWFNDSQAPAMSKEAVISTGNYTAGNRLYISVPFSEIITVKDSSALKLPVALDQVNGKAAVLDADYVTGSGTTDLVFCLTIPEKAVSAGVSLGALQGTDGRNIIDLVGNRFSQNNAVPYTRNKAVAVNSMPYLFSSEVTERNQGMVKVRVNVSSTNTNGGVPAFTYCFQKAGEDGNPQGDIVPREKFESGSTLVLSGGTGLYYLHVMAKDSLGSYFDTAGPYEIANEVPEFAVRASTKQWTNRPVELTMEFSGDYCQGGSAASQLERMYIRDTAVYTKDNFPVESASALDSGALTVTENGTWTFYAKDTKSGNAYAQTVSVSCIDTAAPSITGVAEAGSNGGYMNHPQAAGVEVQDDAKGSGIAWKRYAWTRSPNAPAEADGAWIPMESTTLSLDAYLQQTGTEKENGDWYLHASAADQAGNRAVTCTSKAFAVAVADPGAVSLTIEVKPLAAGRNQYGVSEEAFTSEELTSPFPARYTNRSVEVEVTALTTDESLPLQQVTLPDGTVVLNLTEDGKMSIPGGENAVREADIEDGDPSKQRIHFTYMADQNVLLTFLAMDTAGNAARVDDTAVTAIDAEAPELLYSRSPMTWTGGDVILKMTLEDAATASYSPEDGGTVYGGAGGIRFLIEGLEGYESYRPYNGEELTVRAKENGSYLVKFKDGLGNSDSRLVRISNIDKNPPQVSTDNMNFGVQKAPVTMQLNFADKEMGLVRVRKIAVTNSAAAPGAQEWQDYDGKVLVLPGEPASYYVHYDAVDGAGNRSTGYFGPYTIAPGKPGVRIISDAGYARVHEPYVLIELPADQTLMGVKYQWSRSITPSAFSWQDLAITAGAKGSVTVKDPALALSGVNGTRYLHLQVNTDRTATESRGEFLFDNDAPVITLLGAQPYTIARGEYYRDPGASAVDAYDNWVAVNVYCADSDGNITKVRNEESKQEEPKKFVSLDTSVSGIYYIAYVAVDKAGNSAQKNRMVIVEDEVAPWLADFAAVTDEDVPLRFAEKDFLDHYGDDSGDSLHSIRVDEVPAHGTLKLGGSKLEAGQIVPRGAVGQLVYEPESDYYGEDRIVWSAFDRDALDNACNRSESARISIQVNSVNDLPVSNTIRSSLDEDTQTVIRFTEQEIHDVESAFDSLRLSITEAPAHGTAVLDQEKKEITYTPNADYFGNDSLQYRVEDEDGGTSAAYIGITVYLVNDSPYFNAGAAMTVASDSGKELRYLKAGDGIVLSWEAAGDAWGETDPLTYALYYQTDEMAAGNEWEKIADGIAAGTSSEVSVHWTMPVSDTGYRFCAKAWDGVRESADEPVKGHIGAVYSRDTIINDSTPPVLQVSPAENGYLKQPRILMETEAPDFDGQYHYQLSYSSDGKSFTESDVISTAENVILPEKEGQYKLKAWIYDQSGNCSRVVSEGIYKKDSRPPSLSLQAVPGIRAVTVEAESGDDTSAASAVADGLTYAFRMDGNAWSEYQDSPGFTFAADPAEDCNVRHTFDVKVKDGAGNETEAQTAVHTLAQDAVSAELTEWDSAGMSIRFTAPENVPQTMYQVWLQPRYGSGFIPADQTGAGEGPWSSAFERTFSGLDEDTEYVLYIQSRNGDKTENAPVAFLKERRSDGTEGSIWKTNKKPVLTLDAGQETVWLASDPNGDQVKTTVTYTGTVEDTDRLFHGCKEDPEVNVTLGGVTVKAVLEPAGNVLSRFVRSITGGEVTRWKWTAQFDMNKAAGGTGSLAGVPDGRYQPVVTALDNKGESAQAVYEGYTYIDRKAPNAPVLTINDAAAVNCGVFTAADQVIVTLRSDGDPETGTVGNEYPSGVRMLSYRLEQQEDFAEAGSGQTSRGWVELGTGETENSVMVTAEGHTLLTARVTDRSGNQSMVKADIYIDRTRPAAGDVSASAEGVDIFDADRWYNRDITVTLSAKDEVGIKRIYAQVTDNAEKPAEDTYSGTQALPLTPVRNHPDNKALAVECMAEVTLSSSQQNYIHYMIEDTAGNRSTYVCGPFKLDKNAPVPVFTIPEKELTVAGASVILQGHSARVDIADYNNGVDTHPGEEHVSGLTKSEFLWLPSRITRAQVEASAETLDVPAATPGAGSLPDDDGGNTADSGIASYNWEEFTNGAMLQQGGQIDGSWNLWVRVTDEAGNVGCYPQSHSRISGTGAAYPAFLFDNAAPNLPASDRVGSAYGNVVNHRTYGSLDVKLEVDDDHYQDSNSGAAKYQYTFSTEKDGVSKDGLPVYRFENYKDFPAFTGGQVLTADSGMAADLRQSGGAAFAALVKINPPTVSDVSDDRNVPEAQFPTLFHLKDSAGGTVFRIAVSPLTGALVLCNSSGGVKHLGGNYHDGQVHRIAVSAGFDSAVKVYADGRYLGRYWFPNIDRDAIETVEFGRYLKGTLFSMSVFGRTLDDSEGKSFVFRTDDVVGDYVLTRGVKDGVSEDGATAADRSGQANSLAFSAVPGFTEAYASDGFVTFSEGTDHALLNLNKYLDSFTAAKALTISTTFKSTAKADISGHAADSWGGRLDNTLFSANSGIYDTLYISPYADAATGEAGVAAVIGTQETGNGTDWSKVQIIDVQGINLCDGRPHNITLTLEGTEAEIYVDGALKASQAVSPYFFSGILKKVDSIKAGGILASSKFKGTLYSTHIFSRALTRDEIVSGAINYTMGAVALLNYNGKEGGETVIPAVDDFEDYVKQGGRGMRFDDGGDYIDLGAVADQINTAGGFSASVRFQADEVRKTGQEWSSGGWNTSDAAVGQRLLTVMNALNTGSNIGLGLYGDGERRVYAYWRDSSEQQITIVSDVVEDLLGRDNYLTMSAEPSGSSYAVTLYLNGGQVAFVRGINGRAVPKAGAHVYIGTHEPPRSGIYPMGSAKFKGTIYNVNIKEEATSLDTHIREARENITAGSRVLASYDLDEIENGHIENRISGTALGAGEVSGYGDSGYALQGNNTIDLVTGMSGEELTNPSITYEAVVSADQIQRGIIWAHGLTGTMSIAGTQKTSTESYLIYTAEKGYWFGYYKEGAMPAESGNETAAYKPAPGEKVRLTVSISKFDGDYSHIKLYANGNLIGTTSMNTAYADSLRIGNTLSSLSGLAFKGTVYDFKVWKTALNAAQIAGVQAYDPADLTVHYDFSDLSFSEKIKDKSGAGHDGSIKGADLLYPYLEKGVYAVGSGQVLTAGSATGTIRIQADYRMDNTAEGTNPNLFCIPGVVGVSELRLENTNTGATLWIPCQGLADNRVGVSLPAGGSARMHLDLTIDYNGQTVSGLVNGSHFSAPVSGLSPAGYQRADTIYAGCRGAGGNEMAGVITGLALWENGVQRVSYAGGQSGNTISDQSGNHINLSAVGGNVKWVPEEGNITGFYPVFSGRYSSYAATETGVLPVNSKVFTYRMKFKALPAYEADGDSIQNYAALGNGTASCPYFLLGSGNSLSLYTSPGVGGSHSAIYLGEADENGCFDLEFTVNRETGGLDATVNGVRQENLQIPNHQNIYPINGQILIAYRDYPTQNAHMTLYAFEAIADGVLLCRYDGTRNADGTMLMDLSGRGNHAAIMGEAGWTAEPYRRSAESVIPAGFTGWKFLKDKLAAEDKTVIDVSNTVVQGKVYLHVWVRDSLGNESQEVYGPFDYDITCPQITLSARKALDKESVGGVTAYGTDGVASVRVADNWDLENSAVGSHTRWAVWETAQKTAAPAAPADAVWHSFEGVADGEGSMETAAFAAVVLKDVGTAGSAKKYYVCVEAVDWLGNTSSEYLYVDKDTLFDDGVPPAVTLKVDSTLCRKAHYVQVDAQDTAESGKTPSGINEASLEYAWSMDAGAVNSEWNAFANHNSLRLAGVTGTYYLHVRLADNAGNQTEAVSGPVHLDNAAPSIATEEGTEPVRQRNITVTAEDSAGNSDAQSGQSGTARVYYAKGSRSADYFTGGIQNPEVTELAANDAGKYIMEVTENGVYTVYASDQAGNEAVREYTESCIDTQVPAVAFVPESTDWSKTSLDVSVRAADSGSAGLATVSYQTDKGAVVEVNGLTPGAASHAFTVKLEGDGEHTITVEAVDRAGNSVQTVSGVYRIDTAPVGIEIQSAGAAVREASRAHRAEVKVTEGLSGIAAVEYGWAVKQEGAGTGSGPDYWTAAVLDQNGVFEAALDGVTGEYELFVRAVSGAGIINMQKMTFRFDNEAPSVDAALEPAGEWCREAVLKVTAEEGASVKVVRVSDNAELALLNNQCIIDSNGMYTVTATDPAGNSASLAVEAGYIDSLSPEAQLLPVPQEGYWYAQPVEVTVSAKDAPAGAVSGMSGIESITCELQGQAPSQRLVLETGGTHTVTARVTDRAGNEWTGSAVYRLDLDAPVLQPEAGVKTDRTLTLAANAADQGGSGLDQVSVSIDGGTPEDVQAESHVISGLTGNTRYRLSVSAADRAGNRTVEAITARTLASAPAKLEVLEATTAGILIRITDGQNGDAPAYQAAVKRGNDQLSAASGLRGGESVRMEFHPDQNVRYDDQLVIEVIPANSDGERSQPSIYKVGGGAEDALVSQLNVAPSVTVATDTDILVRDGQTITLTGTYSDVNTGDAVTVSVSLAGVAGTVTQHEGGWTAQWDSSLIREGSYRDIAVKAEDSHGASSETLYAHAVTVDKTRPNVPVLTWKPGITADGWNRVLPVFMLADGLDKGNGGPTQMYYQLGSGQVHSAAAGAELTPEESETAEEMMILYWAEDQAGNISEKESCTVRFDGTNPALSASAVMPAGSWTKESNTVTLVFTDRHLSYAGYAVDQKAAPSEELSYTPVSITEETGRDPYALAEIRLGQEGRWYVHGKAVDAAGNEVQETFGPYLVDRTAPRVPDAAADTIEADRIVLAVAQADDSASGVSDGDIAYEMKTGTGWQAASGREFSGLKSNALYAFRVSASDRAGNRASGGISEYATLALDGRVDVRNGVIRGADSFTFRITPDPGNEAPAQYRIVLERTDGGEPQQTASEFSFDTEVTLPAGDGEYAAYLITRNRAGVENPPAAVADGNGRPAALRVTSAPEISITDVSYENDVITMKGVVSDKDSAAVMVKVEIDGLIREAQIGRTDEGQQEWTLTWNRQDGISDGIYGLFAAAAEDETQSVARAEYTLDPPFKLDFTGPEAPVCLENTDVYIKPDTPLNFTEGRDALSLVTGWSYQIGDSGVVRGEGSQLPQIHPKQSGQYEIAAWYTDEHGNEGTKSVITVRVDGQGPVLSKEEELLGELGFEPVEVSQEGIWSNTNIRLNITAEDDCALAEAGYYVSDTPDLENVSYIPAAVNGGKSASIVLTLTDALQYVYLMAEDAAGSRTEQLFGPYRIDREFPTAQIGYLTGDVAAKGHSVTVTASDGENQSGLQEENCGYLWSEEPTADTLPESGWRGLFADGAEGDAVVLEDSGRDARAYAYIRLTDRAGNETLLRSDGRTFDNSAPVITVDDSSLNRPASEYRLPVTAEDASRIAVLTYARGAYAGSLETAAGMCREPLTDQLLTVTGNGIYTIYAEDEAGNASALEVSVSGIDRSAPAISADPESERNSSQPYYINLHFQDDKMLDSIGWIPAGEDGGVPGPYDSVDDIRAIAEETEFTQLKTGLAARETQVKVGVGVREGADCYVPEGGRYLHFMAEDSAGNRTYVTFGPYELDTLPPDIIVEGSETHEIAGVAYPVIYAALKETNSNPRNDVETEFTGYTVTDNVTQQFVNLTMQKGAPVEEGAGTLELIYNETELKRFAEAGAGGLVVIRAKDGAGNVSEKTVYCRVRDMAPPYYGNSQEPDDNGRMPDNCFTVKLKEDEAYTFTEADFVNDRLRESSGLAAVVIRELPSEGMLYYNGVPVEPQPVPQEDWQYLPDGSAAEDSKTKVELAVGLDEIRRGALGYVQNEEHWYGRDSFRFFGRDLEGNESGMKEYLTTVYLEAEPVNDLPVIQGLAKSSETEENEEIRLEFAVSDVETAAEKLVITIDGEKALTERAAIDNRNGNITLALTPKPHAYGEMTLEIKVTDEDGGRASQSVTCRIRGINDPVKAVDDGIKTAERTVRIDVLSNDEAWDGEKLKLESVTNGSCGTAVAEGDQVVYTWSENAYAMETLPRDVLTYTISYTGGNPEGTMPEDRLTAKIYINDSEAPLIEDFRRDFGPGQWARQVSVSAKVTDDSLKSVVITDAEGNPVYRTQTAPEDRCNAVIRENGSYIMVAEDSSGNRSSYPFAVDNIDSDPPEVNVPDQDGLWQNWIRSGHGMQVEVTDKGGSPAEDLTLEVSVKDKEGRPESVRDVVITRDKEDDSRWTIRWLPESLLDGEHSFTVTAADKAGNRTAYEAGKLTLDAKAPVISVNGAGQEQNVFYAAGTVMAEDAESGLKSVAVNGDPRKEVTGSFRLPMAIGAEEDLVYEVKATDQTGNTGIRRIIMKKVPDPVKVTGEDDSGALRDTAEKIKEEINGLTGTEPDRTEEWEKLTETAETLEREADIIDLPLPGEPMTEQERVELDRILQETDIMTEEQRGQISQELLDKLEDLRDQREAQEVIDEINRIPDHSISTDCEDFDIHRQQIEEAKYRYEQLSENARKLIPKELSDKLNRQYEELLRILNYRDKNSDGSVQVIGLSTRVELRLPVDSRNVLVYVDAYRSVPQQKPVPPAGKYLVMGYFVRMMVRADDREPYEVLPYAGQRVLMKLAAELKGCDMDTMQILHVNNDGSIREIGEFMTVRENGTTYVILEAEECGSFLFYAKELPKEPEEPHNSNKDTNGNPPAQESAGFETDAEGADETAGGSGMDSADRPHREQSSASGPNGEVRTDESDEESRAGSEEESSVSNETAGEGEDPSGQEQDHTEEHIGAAQRFKKAPKISIVNLLMTLMILFIGILFLFSREHKRKKAAAAVTALAAVLLFILTQPMIWKFGWLDIWTVGFAILLVIQLTLVTMVRLKE